MSSEELIEFPRRIESRYIRRLFKAWEDEPEEFAEYVRELEEVIDLRKKISE